MTQTRTKLALRPLDFACPQPVARPLEGGTKPVGGVEPDGNRLVAAGVPLTSE